MGSLSAMDLDLYSDIGSGASVGGAVSDPRGSKDSTGGKVYNTVSAQYFFGGGYDSGPGETLASLYANGKGPGKKRAGRPSAESNRSSGGGPSAPTGRRAGQPVSSARSHGWYETRSQAWQRRLLQQPWLAPVAAMQLAALVIQRAWRSSWLVLAKPSAAPESVIGKIRRQINSHRLATESGLASGESDAAWAGIARAEATGSFRDPRFADKQSAADALKHRFLDHIRRYNDKVSLATSGMATFRGYEDYYGNGLMDEFGGGGRERKVYPTFDHFCAAVVQGRWRSYVRLRIARRVKSYLPFKLYHVAAFEIQRAWKTWFQSRDSVMIVAEDAEDLGLVQHARRCAAAAVRIQRAWRSVLSYRIYQSLRDTVNTFAGCGDPCLLLRSVLPRESMLLDPSMQVHVRFRLGGCRFPPTIYYKIFTHGAVVDVCAFAPRNYAAEEKLGKGFGAFGWYEREENNGWRPLAARLCPGEERLVDEVERRSSRKVIKNFHHSRLKRRQDVERQRRQRTIDWMRKLYTMREEEEGVGADQLEGFTPRGAKAELAHGRQAEPTAWSGKGADTVATAPRPEPRPPDAPRPGRASRRPMRTLVSDSGRATPDHTGGSARDDQRLAGDGQGGSWPDGGGGDPAQGELLDDQGLLDWSQQLDFDAYIGTWQKFATSDVSEGTLPIAGQLVGQVC